MRLWPETLINRVSIRVSLGSTGARVVSLLLLITLAGCSSLTKQRHEQDLVEADLRSQERHIQELKAEVERKEGTIHGMDLEIEKLQQTAAGRKPAGEPSPPGVIKEISLGRLTGGYRNNPRSQYDDSLQFLVEPKDADGHAIKVPGSMHIELFEITPAGLKVPLGAWDITHREVRRAWDQPLFGGPSYRILIPFKALPANEKLRVLVRFTTLDNNVFEAEKDFSIRLPMPGAGPMVPMSAVPGGYSVVTPGHMINGTLVGPLKSAGTPTAPPALEGTGRSGNILSELPAPPLAPMPEKKAEPAKPEEKKPGAIPVIPIEPRKTPSNVPSSIENKGNEPPPLPPPPEIPNFDAKKVMNYEQLPTPSGVARTASPLYPKESGVVQAGLSEPASTALTSPPPASWRRNIASQLVQVDYSGDAAIKLSRPVIVK